MIRFKAFSILIIAFLLTWPAYTCTIIVAGKKATKDGSVIVSHSVYSHRPWLVGSGKR